jgi:hypothetical protein
LSYNPIKNIAGYFILRKEDQKHSYEPHAPAPSTPPKYQVRNPGDKPHTYVNRNVTEIAYLGANGIAEYPQEKHISKKVQKAAVEPHVAEKSS